MAKFQFDGPNGSFEIEAPDEQTAIKAFQQTVLTEAGKSTEPLSVDQLVGTPEPAAGAPASPPQQPKDATAAGPMSKELTDALAAASHWSQTLGADAWRRGTLLPIETNRVTGANRLAMPQFLLDIGNAISAPGKALSGDYGMEVDPKTGRPTLMTQEMTGDAAGLAGLLAGGSAAPRGVPTATRTAAAANEFDIPLTRGQASGKLPEMAAEEALRQAGGGFGAGIMRSFDARQADSIREAANRVGAGLGGPSPNMADQVMTGLRTRAFLHKDAADSLYDIARTAGTSVKAEALGALPASVQRSLAEASVIVDEQLTPAATIALREIEKAARRAGALDPAAPKTGPIRDAAAVSLEGLEQVRKRLVGLKPDTNKPADAAALAAVKDAFDKWYDDSIDNMLFSGDPVALDALKAARREWTFYKQIASGRSGNPASQTIAKMQREDATAEEVANWLYGADIASPSLNAPKVAANLKLILGPQSAEWAAIRGAAWERLVRDFRSDEGGVRSATMMANRISDFLNKGNTLSHVLFTEAERAQMQRFASVLRTTVPPKDATNPSRSGWIVRGSLDGISRMLMAGAGAAADWALTGSMGLGGGAVSFLAYPVMRGAKRTIQAARATAQPDMAPPQMFRTAPVAGPAINATARSIPIMAGGESPTPWLPRRP